MTPHAPPSDLETSESKLSWDFDLLWDGNNLKRENCGLLPLASEPRDVLEAAAVPSLSRFFEAVRRVEKK